MRQVRVCHPTASPRPASQQRPVPLVPDPSGRLGLYSSHVLVIDGQQGIDGRHRSDFTGYGTGLSAAPTVAISAMAGPRSWPAPA